MTGERLACCSYLQEGKGDWEPFKLKIIPPSVHRCLENKAICSNSLQMEIYHLVRKPYHFSGPLYLYASLPLYLSIPSAVPIYTTKHIKIRNFLVTTGISFKEYLYFLDTTVLSPFPRMKLRVLLNIFNKPNLILYLYK